MFREIRTSEKITDQDEKRRSDILSILDKRISNETVEELNNFWKNEFKKEADKFNPDKRMRV